MDLLLFLSQLVAISSISPRRNTGPEDFLQILNGSCPFLFLFPHWLFTIISMKGLQRRGASGGAGEKAFGIHLREFSELESGFSGKDYNTK